MHRFAVVLLLLAHVTPAAAQSRAARFDRLVSAPARAQFLAPRFTATAAGTSAFAAQERSGGSAFLIEALGGAAGAFVGGGLIILAREECDAEDLSCILETLGVAGVGSVVGATAGTYFAGRAAGTRPSLLGAGLGAAVGLAAGAGVVKLLEEANVRGAVLPVLGLTLTEGTLAALGSRLLSR